MSQGTERQDPFEFVFGSEGYGPGDEVSGELLAAKEIPDCGRVVVSLFFMERSGPHSHFKTAGHEIVHEGGVDDRQRIRFRAQMPDDARPDWRGEPGSLRWEIVAMAMGTAAGNLTARESVPQATEPSRWRGTDPEPDKPKTKSAVRRWDVEIEPDRWTVHRGEEVGARLRIGKPEAGRDTLRVGLVCSCKADFEEERMTEEGPESVRRSRSSLLFERWFEIDPSIAEQTVSARIPEDSPYSYDEGASPIGFEWKLVATEDKRLRSARREAILRVLP